MISKVIDCTNSSARLSEKYHAKPAGRLHDVLHTLLITAACPIMLPYPGASRCLLSHVHRLASLSTQSVRAPGNRVSGARLFILIFPPYMTGGHNDHFRHPIRLLTVVSEAAPPVSSNCILDVLATWHDRSVQRRTLAGLSEYQLHDIGLSRSQVFYEIEKPCGAYE